MVKRDQAITLYNVGICVCCECLQRVKYFLEHNYTIIILPLKATYNRRDRLTEGQQEQKMERERKS